MNLATLDLLRDYAVRLRSLSESRIRLRRRVEFLFVATLVLTTAAFSFAWWANVSGQRNILRDANREIVLRKARDLVAVADKAAADLGAILEEGRNDRTTTDRLERLRHLVRDPHWADGMSSSLRAAFLEESNDAALVQLERNYRSLEELTGQIASASGLIRNTPDESRLLESGLAEISRAATGLMEAEVELIAKLRAERLRERRDAGYQVLALVFTLITASYLYFDWRRSELHTSQALSHLANTVVQFDRRHSPQVEHGLADSEDREQMRLVLSDLEAGLELATHSSDTVLLPRRLLFSSLSKKIDVDAIPWSKTEQPLRG